ncbi:hypothetical protein ACJJTC_007410 [Scirpophaga incertulas]
MVQVIIPDGILEGELVDNDYGEQFYSFKGIPYAKPPLGDLRFKAPRPVKPWDGVKQAKQFGPNCYQREVFLQLPPDGCEDCLYINVYSPNIKPRMQLPVMVWIHGGGFVWGSGDDNMYGPEFLLRHDVVVVTLNYRLGALGFLCLDTEEVPGNAGMKDQVLALKWVQKNIGYFGGDASKVSIFGESAGGASVTFHLISPMSKGLFNRVIFQSGCILNFWSRIVDPRQKALALARKHGFYSEDNRKLYEFFKNLPVEKMIDHTLNTTLGRKLYELDWAIVSEKEHGEERFFFGDVSDFLISGIHDGVEVLAGYTEDEGMLAYNAPQVTEDIIYKYSNDFLEFFVPKQIAVESPLSVRLMVGNILKNYYFKNGMNPRDNLDGLLNYLRMDFFIFELISFVKFVANTMKNQVYLYKFTCKSERNQITNMLGLNYIWKDQSRSPVCHADELLYLFNPKAVNLKLDQNSDTFRMIDNITKLWTNFAKYGNPTPDNSLGVQWTPYSLQHQRYLNIGNTLVSETAPEKDDVKLWEALFKQTVPQYVI